MIAKLEARLNQIPQRITSEGFLRGTGIGNEVASYIFDYPPEAELKMREYINFLSIHLAKTHPALRIRHLNLFEFFIKSLEARGFLERAYAKQKILFPDPFS